MTEKCTFCERELIDYEPDWDYCPYCGVRLHIISRRKSKEQTVLGFA